MRVKGTPIQQYNFYDPDDNECSWQAVYIANRVQLPRDE